MGRGVFPRPTTLIMKTRYYQNNIYKGKSDLDKQYFDVDEFLIRRCIENKINWKTLTMEERTRMAKRYGCYREYVDGCFGEKDAMHERSGIAEGIVESTREAQYEV